MDTFLGLLQVFSGIAICITVIRGISAFISDVRPGLARSKRWIAVAVGIAVLAGVGLLLRQGKYVASRYELLTLREIAEQAHQSEAPTVAIRLMSWAIQFEPDEESFYRVRARGYKRTGDYQNEIVDRKKVLELNPGRERNHLPIIEDYILLKEYDHARQWISEHRRTIADQDVQTMFDFFDLLIAALKNEEHLSQVSNFRARAARFPLTNDFKAFWDWTVLDSFMATNSPRPFQPTYRELVSQLNESKR